MNLKLSLIYHIEILKKSPVYVLGKLVISIVRSAITILSVILIQSVVISLEENNSSLTIMMLLIFVIAQLASNMIY